MHPKKRYVALRIFGCLLLLIVLTSHHLFFVLLGKRIKLWTRRANGPRFSCPSSVEIPDNDFLFQERYGYATDALPTNINDFLGTFRTKTYDDWVRTYEQMKTGMYDWKTKYFAPNLNDGDSIYESACGIGLNLYLTLEILNEVKGLESLVLYGNDIVEASTQYANYLFEKAPPFGSKKGTICTGDSDNLDFVPSDAFDFVYTGFISPIMDVLDIDHRWQGNRGYLLDLCEKRVTDWKARKLSDIAQQKQNDWHAKWVSELVRIAKPGKSIAIEQVNSPFCEDRNDFGGVAKEWWRSAVKEYEWDVDPDSIVFQDDTIYPKYKRYHVYMRKNPAH